MIVEAPDFFFALKLGEPGRMIRRWQDWANYLTGLWLFGSPWLLEHPMVTGFPQAGTQAMFNFWTVGLMIVFLTSIVIDGRRGANELGILALGGWLIISPWILRFNASQPLMWNAVLCGTLIFLLAGWRFTQDRRYRRSG